MTALAAFSPESLEDALVLRSAHPDALVIAGGTDTMVAVNMHGLRPRGVLDLSRIDELRCWTSGDDGSICVGAGVTFATLAAEPNVFGPLAQAARLVGSPQIRNRATLGGNVGTASPAGDGIAVLAAFDAEIELARTGGSRTVPWHDFYLGPKRTALEPDELIVSLRWRHPAGPGAFAKVGTRNAMVISVAGVCLQLDERAHAVRLSLGSVAPTVLRAWRAEELAAAELDWDAPDHDVVEWFGAHAAAAARPIDDVRGSAVYRRHAVSVLARRLLHQTLTERSAA